MAVVTISRQYASGGSSIARAVAGRLAWTLVDNEFIDLVARRAGRPAEEVARCEERVEGLVDRLARTLSVAAPETFLAMGEHREMVQSAEAEIHAITQAVLTEVTQGDDVVLVGRGAQAFFHDRPDSLHVFVAAPLDLRIERAAERMGVTHRDAAREVERIDDQRREYVRARYDRVWDDPATYHLVVNSGLWSFDDCAAVIAAAAQRRFGLVAGA